MKRFWLTICLVMFMTRPGLAQDLPIKKIMIIEGMRSLMYGTVCIIKSKIIKDLRARLTM